MNTGTEMAQPGIAREPSMEEILASIRKIIESNDVGPDRMSAEGATVYIENSVVEFDGDESDLSSDQLDISTLSLDAANDPGRMPVLGDNALAPESKSVSLADLAARVRATVQRAEPEEAMMAPPVVSRAPVEDSPLMTSRLASLRSSGPVGETPATAKAPEVGETLRTEVEAQLDVPTSTAQTEDQADESLVSPEAGALVAQSFSDLAAAIDGHQRRSLDEMAEELLRPMLREWLDDNLPQMVERLVREEIERVARGPRR